MIKNRKLELLSMKIRYNLLLELDNMGFGHYGGSLSIVEVLAVIYGQFMGATKHNRSEKDRNYFVLSKGHAGPALFATLKEFGFFTEDILMTLNEGGSILPSHPNRILTPGVDVSTGSLGQGVSSATGIAYGLKLMKSDNYVYTIIGDGEMNEGQCWEAVQFTKAKKLDNLIMFVDNNKKQLDGRTIDINVQLNYADKFKSFGFHAIDVDGSNVDEIEAAILIAKSIKGKPSVIILDTIKGQGVKHIEELEANHHLRPTVEDTQAIKDAIEQLREDIKRYEL